MIGRSSSSNDRTDTAVACPQVAKRFLAAVKECSGPGLDMALFISYDPEDIMKQAEQSTLRYQQGTVLLVEPFPVSFSKMKHIGFCFHQHLTLLPCS
jgi:hypothetical protein